MQINRNIESERKLTLAISGSIDTNTALQLREAVAAVPADTQRLTLDFRDVYNITSAGLRELLVCAQRFPEEHLRLINVSPDVMEVLSITGFDDILNVEAAEEDLSTFVHMSFKELLARHVRQLGDKVVLNHFMIAYGLSEMAPVSVTLYEDTDAHILRSVGKQVENISIRILDRATGEDCPTGTPGEILVQGFNLMTGYYKVPLQDQAIDEEGWLHTGDMGYLDADGYLTLSGRYKELIIRGGENIMPSEVESAISELDIIESVKVIGVPSDFYGEEVGACVKLKTGATFDEAAVKAELLKRLAKYKVPSHFVVYDEFPMLGSGRIDGVALKADALKRIKEG